MAEKPAQSAGFTWEDVEMCRRVAERGLIPGAGYQTMPTRLHLQALADRIEALLPPKAISGIAEHIPPGTGTPTTFIPAEDIFEDDA